MRFGSKIDNRRCKKRSLGPPWATFWFRLQKTTKKSVFENPKMTAKINKKCYNFSLNLGCVFWGSRNPILRILCDFRSPRGSHVLYFLSNVTDFLEKWGTSILWDPTLFSSYFRAHDHSEKHNKAKSKAFENKCYFGYDQNRPRSDFPRFQV